MLILPALMVVVPGNSVPEEFRLTLVKAPEEPPDRVPSVMLPPPLVVAVMPLLRALRLPVLMLPPLLAVRMMLPLKLLPVPLALPLVVMPPLLMAPSTLSTEMPPLAEPLLALTWVPMAAAVTVPPTWPYWLAVTVTLPEAEPLPEVALVLMLPVLAAPP